MSVQRPIALNTSTIIDPDGDVSLEDELAGAAAAGWTHLELRGPRVAGRDDLPDLMSAHGLSALTINAVELARGAQALEQAEQFARAGALVEAPYLLAVSGTELDGMADQVVEVKRIAASFGLRTAFEFLGFERFAVRDLRGAIEIARAADVEVVIDFHHWFSGGCSIEDLELLRDDELAIVHLNDLPAGDPLSFTDADRQLPGEGGSPIREVLAAIEATGYAGPASVETFNPTHWALGPGPAAAAAAAATAAWTDSR
jgi:sugar phosphate isomerase/epimerase